jgi:hypothetical protein
MLWQSFFLFSNTPGSASPRRRPGPEESNNQEK